MKRLFVIFLTIITLAGCAGMERRHFVEDLGSPEKEELLRQRVEEFWSAFLKRDYKRVYEIFDPFFRARRSFQSYMNIAGIIRYHEFEIKDIKIEGNVAKVKMRVVYSVPKMKFKHLEFKVPKTSREFEETWLYIYDNWYKEFYLKSIDVRFTEY